MNCLQDLSLLEKFWGVQAVVVGGVFVYNVLTGSYSEKNANQKDTDETLGWFQFRRRQPMYLALGSLAIGWVGWNVFSVHVWGGESNSVLTTIVNCLINPTQPSEIVSSRLRLATGLFNVHIFKSLYENMFVQVASRKQVINPIHALLNIAYYPLAVLSLNAEAFPLTQQLSVFSFNDLRVTDLCATGVFFAACYVSNQTFKQLAKLRRNRFGHVTNTSYKMPTGSMFQLVSCPHYMSEMLVYGSLAAILGKESTTWMYLTGYVCATQVYLAHSTHAWYNRKFEDYPQNRKRLIPYLI